MDIVVYVGVVISITQIIKKAFVINSRFVPFVALLIGAVFFIAGYLLGVVTFDYKSIMDAVVGILSAMGLFSTLSATGNIISK